MGFLSNIIDVNTTVDFHNKIALLFIRYTIQILHKCLYLILAPMLIILIKLKLIRSHVNLISLQTPFIFFHELGKDNDCYIFM